MSTNDEKPKVIAFPQHLKSNPPFPMAPVFEIGQVEKIEVKQPSLKEKDAPKVVKKEIVGLLDKATGIVSCNGKKMKYRFIEAPIENRGNKFQFQPP